MARTSHLIPQVPRTVVSPSLAQISSESLLSALRAPCSLYGMWRMQALSYLWGGFPDLM